MLKKISRRTMLITSAAAAGATLLPGCNFESKKPQVNKSGKKRLVLSSYTWSGYEKAINAKVDEWLLTQPPGSVEVERQITGGANYWDKLQTQIASGTVPDVGIGDYGRFVSYAKNGALLDISDFIKTSDFPIGSFMPAALAQYRWSPGDFDSGNPNGHYYGLPSDAQSQIMVYNKKMFDEAGVVYPTDDWTWDHMLDAARVLTDKKKERFGFYIDPTLLWKGILVRAAGGSFISPDYKRSLINSAETREAITWLWRAACVDKVAMGTLAPNMVQPFLERKVAMTIDGVWWLSDFNQALDKGEYDVCLMPKHPKTGKRTTTVESDGWWIFKGTQHPELAWSLLQYLACADTQKKFTEEGYIFPSCIPEIAASWYAQKPPESRSKVLDNIIQDSLKIDITWFEALTMQAMIHPLLQRAFIDGNGMDEALEKSDKVMNAEIETAWEIFNS